MKYQKPILKSLTRNCVNENMGPTQTGYGQIIWQQTQRINSSQTYNQQVHTNQLAGAGIVRLDKRV
jgi:hypothetical protein